MAEMRELCGSHSLGEVRRGVNPSLPACEGGRVDIHKVYLRDKIVL